MVPAATSSPTGTRVKPGSGDARQMDAHGRAVADRAIDLKEAAGLGDDLIDHRQAEPGAAVALGGKERLEDAPAGRLVHAGAAVGDAEDDISARSVVVSA